MDMSRYNGHWKQPVILYRKGLFSVGLLRQNDELGKYMTIPKDQSFMDIKRPVYFAWAICLSVLWGCLTKTALTHLYQSVLDS